MKRNKVYKRIDEERAYQYEKWGDPSKTPTEFLVYMQDYLTEAFNHATRFPNPGSIEMVLEDIRKITAMGVACMEQHGCPPRVVKVIEY